MLAALQRNGAAELAAPVPRVPCKFLVIATVVSRGLTVAPDGDTTNATVLGTPGAVL